MIKVPGAITGAVAMWVDRQCKLYVPIHKGWIQRINYCDRNIIFGGSDKTIQIMNPDTLQVEGTIKVS